ncbi:sorbosone dehydrogenase family protein [Massilia sp. ZL223]|uniref:PQQ-dependent sugar dehydrogenase n=1 Tax=Massilia sp. ZL223 TaxID=2824904 RepID=UPI001B836ADD|nr:PQQ-dependent sugar dehydrogenase [Massilia sp. ZL223]MBQ5963729.1 PQQ-dependent sugar dehydrogenase [Massilia sp. ZL223]
MLLEHMRKWMLLLLPRLSAPFLVLCLATLGACGGGGGSAGTPGPVTPPSATTGSLTVTATGLPSGVNAAMRVTGPNNYLQDLTQTQTLTGLAPGSYNVAATAVTSGNTTYTPSPASQSAVVSAGATANATVAYGSPALTLALSTVATNLDNPTWLSAPPGDTRLFVTERAGRVRIIQNGAVLSTPLLDISARVLTEGEGGLLSLAFDPQYARNGYVYLYYTDPQRNIVVERFTTGSSANIADPTSGLEIISIPHPTFTNHFGGLVSFGPDGYLYVGTGDGGGAGDPQGNAQNLNSLLGKLLRIDVSLSVPAESYAIPGSNPFVNMSGRRPEIWAYGLRNPWRYAFDGNQLYLSDVGQDRREEVNIADNRQGGQNYGWNVMEGTLCYNTASCNQAGLTLPAFEYDHGSNDANGCSITGGFVYRGRALPELAGRYFYSDFCTGFLKSFSATGAGIVEQRDWNLPDIGRVVSFGQDAEGELYLVAASGTIHKIGRNATP